MDNMAKYMSHSGYVTYAASGDDALSGGPLETLIVNGGEVFPSWKARIIEKKVQASSDMLRNFYCPVCPATILRLGIDPLAKCAVCRWTSKKVEGLLSVSDLMARDVEAWPRVVRELNEVVERWKNRVEKKRNDRLKHGKRSKNVGYSGDGDEIGRDDGSDERMRGLIRVLYKDTQDEGYMDERYLIHADTIVIAPNIYRHFEMPPKRRIPQNILQIVAPSSNRIVEEAVIMRPKKNDNAAKLLPRVTSVVVDYDSENWKSKSNNDLAHLWLEVTNDTKKTVVLNIANHGAQRMEAKSKEMIELKAGGRRVRHGDTSRSELVVPLLFKVKVEDIEEEMRYSVFVWHYRALLSPEARWLKKTAAKRIA